MHSLHADLIKGDSMKAFLLSALMLSSFIDLSACASWCSWLSACCCADPTYVEISTGYQFKYSELSYAIAKLMIVPPEVLDQIGDLSRCVISSLGEPTARYLEAEGILHGGSFVFIFDLAIRRAVLKHEIFYTEGQSRYWISSIESVLAQAGIEEA